MFMLRRYAARPAPMATRFSSPIRSLSLYTAVRPVAAQAGSAQVNASFYQRNERWNRDESNSGAHGRYNFALMMMAPFTLIMFM